jgi:hypothetical protein
MIMIQDWVRVLCDAEVVTTQALTGQPERHPLDVPFSSTCGTRSSRERTTRENARCETGEWQDRAAAALEVPPTVVRRLTEFTDDGAVVLAVRRDIAELLEQAKTSSEEV